MIHVPPSLLAIREEFERRSKLREEDRLVMERDFLNKQKRREEREARDEQQDDLDMLVAVVMASDEDISFAMAERDTLDVATVEALIVNSKALEKAEEDLRIILDRAYVLPDGRRVFKTEDGTRIFDEHGQEVTDFDPHEIEDTRPRYEEFQVVNDGYIGLQEERRQLLEYQSRLDGARERLDAGDITKDELDELMSGLREDIPDAVRARLPEDAAPERAADTPSAPGVGQGQPLPAARLDMPVL